MKHRKLNAGRFALSGLAIATACLWGLNAQALGLGRLTVEAVLSRDFPVIQALILLFAVGYVFVNLLIDVGYALLDPRIRY